MALGATVSNLGAPLSCASSKRLPPQRIRVTVYGSPRRTSMQFAAKGNWARAPTCAIISLPRSVPNRRTASGFSSFRQLDNALGVSGRRILVQPVVPARRAEYRHQTRQDVPPHRARLADDNCLQWRARVFSELPRQRQRPYVAALTLPCSWSMNARYIISYCPPRTNMIFTDVTPAAVLIKMLSCRSPCVSSRLAEGSVMIGSSCVFQPSRKLLLVEERDGICQTGVVHQNSSCRALCQCSTRRQGRDVDHAGGAIGGQDL